MKENDSEKLKEAVKEKYAAISEQPKSENEGSCCGSSCDCDTVDYSIFADDYSSIDGYNQEADLGLGCGLPTDHAHISKGDIVVDLGSGAGNDCFVARELTGETGEVIGLDMTMMLQIDFASLKEVSNAPKGVGWTVIINWLVKPFSMAFFAWLFFNHLFGAWLSSELADQYIAGAVILGAAPCTAMVFVWSPTGIRTPLWFRYPLTTLLFWWHLFRLSGYCSALQISRFHTIRLLPQLSLS